jgi:hypothetical protein
MPYSVSVLLISAAPGQLTCTRNDIYIEDFDLNRPVNWNFQNTLDTKVLSIYAFHFISLNNQ